MNYVKGRNGRYLKEAGPHKKGHHIITHVLLFVIVMHLIARVRLQIFFLPGLLHPFTAFASCFSMGLKNKREKKK